VRGAGSAQGAGPTGVGERTGAERSEPVEEVVGRERVAELQRARIVVAMGELVYERGAGAVTVAHVVARSGVSRRTFYEIFADRDACLLATFDDAVERAAALVVPAYEAGDGTAEWKGRIRAGLQALLGFLDDEPALASLLIVDALAAERRVLERRQRVVDALIDAVHRGAAAHAAREDGDRGLARARAGRAPRRGARRSAARIVAEGLVGAVFAVIHARLLARDTASLRALSNPLMATIVLPYLGSAAAELELERPRPRSRPRTLTPADPLREIDMRLTYRTVRVLLAIAELGERGSNPSGRQVADASGVADQGQMSKLLARLRSLGLIHNSASGRGKGEPNAWRLTPTGEHVERAIRAQTAS
jgi:AcrR family transcriptional regulator